MAESCDILSLSHFQCMDWSEILLDYPCLFTTLCLGLSSHYHPCCRTDSKFAPSQWEMALLSKDISQWLGASLESALIPMTHFCQEAEWLLTELTASVKPSQTSEGLVLSSGAVNCRESLLWDQGPISQIFSQLFWKCVLLWYEKYWSDQVTILQMTWQRKF